MFLFEKESEKELIKILESKSIEGYINCELVIKDFYLIFGDTTHNYNISNFVSVNLENAVIKPIKRDLNSSQTLKQEKDGNIYTVTVTHDSNDNYSIHIFNEKGKELQSISLENEFFKGLKFKDLNLDGYMDIVVDIGRPLNETKVLYTWDINTKKFAKVIFEGFNKLKNFFVKEDYIESFPIYGITQKFVWKGNTLILESEEGYKIGVDEQIIEKYEFKHEKTGENYVATVTKNDFYDKYVINIYGKEKSNWLQTIFPKTNSFIELKFKNTNLDGYTDIIYNIGDINNKTYELYIWNIRTKEFEKIWYSFIFLSIEQLF